MKKKLSILSITLLLALLVCMPVMAATVCKIGSKGYSSLLDAVNAVKDGQTIKVTKAIKTSEPFSTFDAKAKKFTIDWCNKKYTYTGENIRNAAFHISAGHSVTVKHLNMLSPSINPFSIAKDGELIIQSGKVASWALIHSYGKVTIKGGTFTATSSEGWTFIQSLDGSELVIQDGTFTGEKALVFNLRGKATIKGGKFHLSKHESIPIIMNSGNSFTISGGTFTGPKTLINTSSKLTISGGIFQSEKYTSGPCIKMSEGSTTKIKGGTFKGGFNTNGKLTISGGKTNAEVVVGEKGNCTITNLTIKQDPSPGKGPGSGAMLVNQGGKLTVKGGKFVSKEGFGYSGNVTFSMKNYKKLFTVKALTP